MNGVRTAAPAEPPLLAPGPAARPRAIRAAADLSLASVAIVWGATFPLGKLVLYHLGPFQYLGLRFGLAALLMAPFAWRERARADGAGLRAGVLSGAVLFAGYALQTAGLRYTTAGHAGLITGLNVVIIPLILLVWRRRPEVPPAGGPAEAGRRRRPDAVVGAAVLLSVAGLWLLLGPGASAAAPAGAAGRMAAGDALVLGCAFALALQAVIVGRVARAVPAAPFACVQIATVAVLAGGAALAVEPRPGPAPVSVARAIAFMAVAATLGAYVAQAWAQRVVPATRTGLLFALEPVAAVVFGAVWLGEALGPRQAAGAAAILAGVLLGEGGREHGIA
jgi:drug/metabolite transporter (DMT)-like permease